MKIRFPSLVWIGFLLGMVYWVLESVLHTYVLDSGSLRETLMCEHDPNELWMRTLVTGLLAAFGWVTEGLVRSERRGKERAMKLNQLFNYIHQISRVVGSKFENPLYQQSQTELTRIGETLLDEGEIGKIVQAVQGLSRYLDSRIEGLYGLLELTHEINKGVLVDEVMDKVYETFRLVIPYDRIGVALLKDDGRILTSRWLRSDDRETRIPEGYSAPMAGSSLQRIIETGEPRIINDLAVYLAEHPNSRSSRLIFEDGIRSSLTCPLIAMGKPIGVIFFSSREPGKYENLHSEVFKLIAGQLSVVIEKSHTYEQLIREKETSESLLLNVMPARIIARMKTGDKNPVEEFSEVGVLFADIVGFSEVARSCSAESVLHFLRDVFTQFDALSERYGVEKIKTIGDAYMVSTGVVSSDKHCLRGLGRFALEMLSTAALLRYPDGRPLKIRIGIHSGPVVAGVIGQKKFAYDMWGDTVNVAQRLESTGLPDHIHVTENVCLLLKEDFAFEPRGEIELKGKGRMTTYFMKEIRTD
ncbi:MAG: GAF domain-containing protein [Candidatus Hydrogenedentes bacterium]|nr:GAF domain-containing protein [Candidatus Hydrogenedentota bacterium]